MQKVNREVEVEFDLLPSGEILVKRGTTQEQSDAVLQLLQSMEMDTSEVEEFLKSSGLIKYIVGDEALCG